MLIVSFLCALFVQINEASYSSYGSHLISSHKGLLLQNPAPWNLRSVAGSKAFFSDQPFEPEATNNRVPVFILDNGIPESHPEFLGKVKTRVVVAKDEASCPYTHRHGCYVASLIGGAMLGACKSVDYYDIQVCGCDEKCSYKNLVAGLAETISIVTELRASNQLPLDRIAIVNISISRDNDLDFSAADILIKMLKDLNVLVIVAAGNENDDACKHFPASLNDVLAVGATTKQGLRAPFSNYGRCVEVWAPGADILVADVLSPLGYCSMQGTSLSSPFIVGLAANFASGPGPHTIDSITQKVLSRAAQYNPKE